MQNKELKIYLTSYTNVNKINHKPECKMHKCKTSRTKHRRKIGLFFSVSFQIPH